MNEKRRTLAFQVEEELFERPKQYLERHQITQKAFVIGLIEDELDRDEELLRKQQERNTPSEEETQDEALSESSEAPVGEDEQEEAPAVGGFDGPDEDGPEMDAEDHPGRGSIEGKSGAALKKIAAAILLDKRNWEKLVCLVFAFFVFLILPGAAAAALFNRDDVDFSAPVTEHQIYYHDKEQITMKNTRTMAIQMPEETYQRMKAYLKRHQVRQKDLVTRLVEAAMEKDDETASGDGQQGAKTVAFSA